MLPADLGHQRLRLVFLDLLAPEHVLEALPARLVPPPPFPPFPCPPSRASDRSFSSLRRYKSMVNLATLSAAFAYIQGTLPEGWFSNIFVFLSLLSLVPSLIASLLGPIFSLLSGVRSALSCITGLGAGIPSGAGGVAAVSAGILVGDIGAQGAMLEAMENDTDEDKSREADDLKDHRDRASPLPQDAFLRPLHTETEGSIAQWPMPPAESRGPRNSSGGDMHGTVTVTVPLHNEWSDDGATHSGAHTPVPQAASRSSSYAMASLTPRHAAHAYPLYHGQVPAPQWTAYQAYPYAVTELVYTRRNGNHWQ